MAIISDVKRGIFRYLNSIVWLQSWGIQEPLQEDVFIGGVEYPPNVVLELPMMALDISTSSQYLDTDDIPRNSLNSAKLAYKIIWVFTREKYPNFRDIPIRQIENLVSQAAQFILVNYNNINPDIVNINYPANGITLMAKPTEDVRSDSAFDNSWSIVCSISMTVDFVSSLAEFDADSYPAIQPLSWQLLEGDDPIETAIDFVLKGMRISVNRSQMSRVNPNDPSTYQLEEEMYLGEYPRPE